MSKIFNWENHKSISEIVVDSAIIAVVAAAATLGNTIPSIAECFVAFKAFAIAFASQFIFERKIKPYRNGVNK